MSSDIYQRLAHHLDNLPGGFPPTESGVELRILQRLFDPGEAELALHLTLIPEEARVIARRAHLSLEEAGARLDAMASKGLIYSLHRPGRTPRYMASQFVVGIWEYHVNDLDPDLIRDFEAYLPTLFDFEVWRKAPQLRTIPIGESIEPQLEVMPYEQAEVLLESRDRFAVAPCICRRERRIVGEGCDRPLETCLIFDGGADYYLRNGLARAIDREQARTILQEAADAGLVLQPGNAREAGFICCCCGCCCGVIRTIKHHPQPARIVSTPFVAGVEPDECTSCGLCTLRCQMDAVSLDDGIAFVLQDRCIGCGLCVITCPTEAMTLSRKPEDQQTPVPQTTLETYLQLGQVRGKLGTVELVGMQVRSKVDRLLASGRASR